MFCYHIIFFSNQTSRSPVYDVQQSPTLLPRDDAAIGCDVDVRVPLQDHWIRRKKSWCIGAGMSVLSL